MSDSEQTIALVTHRPPHDVSTYHHLTLEWKVLSADRLHLEDPGDTNALEELTVDTCFERDGANVGLWYLRYGSLYHVQLYELEPKVKLLRDIERKLKAYDRDWGQAGSYGAYCTRVCKAVGTTHFTRWDMRDRVEANCGWPVFKLADLTYHIETTIGSLKERAHG